MPRKSQPKATAKPAKKPAKAASASKKTAPEDKAPDLTPVVPTHQVVDHVGACLIVLPQSLQDMITEGRKSYLKLEIESLVMTVIHRDFAHVHYVNLPIRVVAEGDKFMQLAKG